MPLFAKLYRWRKKGSSLCLASAMIAILATIAAIIWFMPSHLHSGQIVNEFGEYRSPQGHFGLTVSKTPRHNVRLVLSRRATRFLFLSSFTDDRPIEFEAEREWFACFDEYERLWLFIGKWDSRWGESRELPSGGYVPHVQSVLLEGFWFGPRGLLHGGNVVSSTGDWAGVPNEFFERIPAKHQAVWGKIPMIPDTPPPLTASQRQAAGSSLAARRNVRRVF
jgi:hypothetical protein